MAATGTGRGGQRSAADRRAAPGPKELSTAIDLYDTHASIDTLMEVAGYFRLNTREAADVLAHVTSAVGHWRTTAASHGLRQAEIEAMEPAFDHADWTAHTTRLELMTDKA